MTTYSHDDSVRDGYPHFEELVKIKFDSFSDKPLFTTDVDNLFQVFIGFLPKESQQHYTCYCCRNFVNRFGRLVYINNNGKLTSVMWDDVNTPPFFRKAVEAMKNIVESARVTGVFVSSDRVLGNPSSGGWTHLNASLPSSKVFRNRLKTAEQEMAEKREDFRILVAGLIEYPPYIVDQAVTLLESETLYRADRVLGVAKFVQELHDKRANAKESRNKENITWLAVATAPSGFTHIKSSMIGTLLDDIVSGLSVDSIKRRFDEKMNPSNYMRSQTAPSQGNIQQAEKIVEQLGIAESLRRRYARFDEIDKNLIWQRAKEKPFEKTSIGGVFANITPKEKQNAPSNVMNLPTTIMTWDKFQRTVLPTAESLEVMVDNPNRLMAVITAANPDAPPIVQWDEEENRNPFTWYYHGGIDGEIKRRVEQAGGQYEGNEIRCSLIWENYTDLDLHVRTPRGEEIYYADKRGSCGGWLDVDMNAGGRVSMSPVENIRWSNGGAREGRYRFFVHNFSERGNGVTPFKVELEVNGKIYTFNGELSNKRQVVAFEFNYVKGQHPTIIGASYTSADAWSVPVNTFTKVKGITESPNLWGENKVPHAGQHIFFILDGAKDTSEGKGRGFFVETLKPELREIRKTLEAYTASTSIEGVEEASACGVGYSKDSEWNLIVKVTANNSTRMIKIDRFD